MMWPPSLLPSFLLSGSFCSVIFPCACSRVRVCVCVCAYACALRHREENKHEIKVAARYAHLQAAGG